jgi:thermostable 8-oxoguanine DNA glycosylase
MCDELARREGDVANVLWSVDSLMREASGCILASQVPHAMAVAALERLAEGRLLPPTRRARFQSLIATALRSPLSAGYPRAYRFPQQAAQRLVRLASVAEQVADIVLHGEDIGTARRDLTALGCGLGAKQASLLLRNVRAGVELAVLDVHLLAFMRVAGLTTAVKVPPALARYENLEDRFRTYAYGLRVPMHRLDRAAWIVMRAARGEKEIAWAS